MMALTCSSARRLISDFVDGECSPGQSTALDRHLKNCPGCQELLGDFRSLKQGAQALESLEPPDTTWLKIRSRISNQVDLPAVSFRPKTRWLTPVASRWAIIGTALALLLVAGGMFIGSLFRMGPDFQTDPLKGTFALAELDEAESHYQQAILALNEAFASQKQATDPEILAVFTRNMAIIDESLEACRQAVSDNPANIESRNYLLAVYKEKVDLLADMINIQDKASLGPGAKTTF